MQDTVRALIVEDECLIAESLRKQIEMLGITVCGIADTAEKAVDLAVRHVPDFVLMDLRLKGEADGADAARAIDDLVGTRVIFLTGSCEELKADRTAMALAAATLFKPVTTMELRRTIESVISSTPQRKAAAR